MPTDKKVPLNTLVRPVSEIVVRPGYPATLDEELAMLVAQREEARGAPPYVPPEEDADEPTRARFLRGTESVSDGYLHRLTGEPASNCDNPIDPVLPENPGPYSHGNYGVLLSDNPDKPYIERQLTDEMWRQESMEAAERRR